MHPVPKKRPLGWGAAAALALVASTLLAPTAQAADDDTPPPPSEVNATVTEVTYTADGKKALGTVTYGQNTEDVTLGEEFPSVGGNNGGPIPVGSGSGGSSSSSGCRKVTVNNWQGTTLGFTAFWYHTWTRWCWTRSTQNIYDVTTGWSISDVTANWWWLGEVNKELGFYDFGTNDGHPRSAYKHYRQGHFEACVVKYNGTWVWSTSG